MQRTLRGLLAWAHAQYVGETPELQHAVSLTDEGGAPVMKPAAASYLGLQAKKLLERTPKAQGRPPFGIPPIARVGVTPTSAPLRDDGSTDDWIGQAKRKDKDGRYVTPLRYAIELCPDPDERAFLRALVPELYYPSEIAEIHGIPKWAAGMVMFAALARLRERYDRLIRDQERGTAAHVPWTQLSESSQKAIEAGEAA